MDEEANVFKIHEGLSDLSSPNSLREAYEQLRRIVRTKRDLVVCFDIVKHVGDPMHWMMLPKLSGCRHRLARPAVRTRSSYQQF